MKKLIFIFPTVNAPNIIRRVNDLIHDHDVIVYAFERDDGYVSVKPFKMEIIGTISQKKSYIARFIPILKALWKVFQKHKNEDVVYYTLGLYLALIICIFSGKQYIYEEADLGYTYLKTKFIRKIFKLIDEYVIRSSLLTVMTSEGFGYFHYSDTKKIPSNVIFVPNKLNKDVLKLPYSKTKALNPDSLDIGFLGGVRFKSLLRFFETGIKEFPNHRFHIYGFISQFKDLESIRLLDELQNFPNMFFHGPFKNPDDLPMIYASLDLLLSTYDAEIENVKFAEPNKIYEAIYFETPIIVTENVFLGDKVERLNIGYAVNPLNPQAVINLIKNLNKEDIQAKIDACRLIPKAACINKPSFFIKELDKILR